MYVISGNDKMHTESAICGPKNMETKTTNASENELVNGLSKEIK